MKPDLEASGIFSLNNKEKQNKILYLNQSVTEEKVSVL